MKKILAVAFVIAIVSASAVSAQTPFVQVYFDYGSGADPTGVCPPGPAGTVFDEVAVIAHNFNMWMTAIEYSIDYGPVLGFIADILVIDGTLKIGNSPSGISLAFPIPQNAFGALMVQKASVLWLCDNCTPYPDTPFPQVLAHPAFSMGYIVQATRWPDVVVVDGLGMASTICPVIVPTEETTWGQLKSLYGE
jgi:hypothetical protein